MRKLLATFLALASVAVAFSDAAASDAYVSVSGGATHLSSTPYFEFANPVWQGRATFQTSFPSGLELQGDSVLTHQDLSGFGDHHRLDTLELAAHLFHREPGQGLIGVFVQHDSYLVGASDRSDAVAQWYGGIEGQKYWRNFSLYGQVAATLVDVGGDTKSGTAARLRARYFFSEQIYVEGKAGVERLASEHSSLSSTILGLAFEYQPSISPAAIFARYTHVSQTSGDDSTIDSAGRILFGVKWSFAGKSLWDRETGGAALEPLEQIHFPVWGVN